MSNRILHVLALLFVIHAIGCNSSTTGHITFYDKNENIVAKAAISMPSDWKTRWGYTAICRIEMATNTFPFKYGNEIKCQAGVMQDVVKHLTMFLMSVSSDKLDANWWAHGVLNAGTCKGKWGTSGLIKQQNGVLGGDEELGSIHLIMPD